MGDDVTPDGLAAELGLSEQEAKELRHAVEYGIICPPVRIDVVSKGDPVRNEVRACPDRRTYDVLTYDCEAGGYTPQAGLRNPSTGIDKWGVRRALRALEMMGYARTDPSVLVRETTAPAAE